MTGIEPRTNIRRRSLLRLIAAFGVTCLGCPAALAESPPASLRSGPKYYPIDRLIVPVIYGGRLRGHLMLYVFLQMKDVDDRPRVTKAMPRLRDEYIRRLSRYVTRRPFILERTNLREIKTLLLTATDKVVGEGVVEEVLVQASSNRRF